MFYRYAK